MGGDGKGNSGFVPFSELPNGALVMNETTEKLEAPRNSTLIFLDVNELRRRFPENRDYDP